MNPVKNYENDERRKKLYLADVYIKKNIPANETDISAISKEEEVGDKLYQDKIEINFS
jgi:hypothetical protein